MEYDFTIAENTVSGILTGSTINTTDDDSTTENQVVTYQITDNGNVDWFGIDGSTVSLQQYSCSHTLYHASMSCSIGCCVY